MRFELMLSYLGSSATQATPWGQVNKNFISMRCLQCEMDHYGNVTLKLIPLKPPYE